MTNETVRYDDAADVQKRAARTESALLVLDVRGDARTAALEKDGAIVVGRDPDCDVVVDDASLSRRHARFTSTAAGALTVEDLGSTNGTKVNGVAVAVAGAHALVAGDEVRLGAAVVTVHGATAGSGGQRRVLVSHERFLAAVDDELARARIFGRGFSLALVRVIGGSIGKIVPQAIAALRPIDRVAAFSDDVLELLLVETSAPDAAAVVDALAGHTGPSACACASAVASYPQAGTSKDALLSAALASLGKTAGKAVHASSSSAASSASSASASSASIVATSPAMAEVMRTVDKIARTVIPVLIVGETGSGKEVIARAIHARSARKDKPLVAVNCGAIPQNLVESTLFGHEKGAFTGADKQHVGVFEAADGGGVFLDEIGELPAAAQTALLRVLETKQITRVGATKERAVDARLMAATHRDLDAMVTAGTFRQDLLYRLNAMTLLVPPLRERGAEIEPLVRAFVDEANARHGRNVTGLTEDARELLDTYRWPGNVRELKNAIERAVVIASGAEIDVEDLPEALHRAPPPASSSSAQQRSSTTNGVGGGADGATSLGERLEKIEAQWILEALDRCAQSVTEAAKVLQLPKRTLQHRMKLLGISRKASYAR